jgi:hypothetical protein
MILNFIYSLLVNFLKFVFSYFYRWIGCSSCSHHIYRLRKENFFFFLFEKKHLFLETNKINSVLIIILVFPLPICLGKISTIIWPEKIRFWKLLPHLARF